MSSPAQPNPWLQPLGGQGYPAAHPQGPPRSHGRRQCKQRLTRPSSLIRPSIRSTGRRSAGSGVGHAAQSTSRKGKRQSGRYLGVILHDDTVPPFRLRPALLKSRQDLLDATDSYSDLVDRGPRRCRLRGRSLCILWPCPVDL